MSKVAKLNVFISLENIFEIKILGKLSLVLLSAICSIDVLYFEANKLIKVAIFIFLAVATFTIYSNVQNHEFLIYDDYKYIKNNLKIKSGLSS